MKNQNSKNSKYYFVSSWNIEYVDDNYNCVSLDDYFEKNGIPEQYRDIVFKVPSNSKFSEEFISEIKFLTTKKGNSIFGISNTDVNLKKGTTVDDICCDGIFFVDGYLYYFDISIVKDFYTKLKNKNLFDNYIKSVSSFMIDGINSVSKRRINKMFTPKDRTLKRKINQLIFNEK